MRIKSRTENISIAKIDCIKEMHYVEITPAEFDDNIEKDYRIIWQDVLSQFQDIIKSKSRGRSICAFFVRDCCTKVEKYLGIWKSLKKENIIFSEKTDEIFINDKISAYAIFHEQDLENIFKPIKMLMVIGDLQIIRQQYSESPVNLEQLQFHLLQNNCCLLEYIDLGIDGQILTFTQHSR